MNIEQKIELQGKQAYPDHEYTRAIYMRGLREMHEQYQSNPSEFGLVKPEEGMMAVQVSIAHPSATLLQVALMMCNEEQLISLRDALIERTPALVRVKQSEDRLKLYEQSFSEWKLESEKTIKEKDAKASQLAEALRGCVKAMAGGEEMSISETIDAFKNGLQTLTNYEQGKGGGGWIEINYDNIPLGEVLLCTTSKVVIKGDWYKDGWRTEWSQWESDEQGMNKLSLLPKESVTHWQPLPAPPINYEQNNKTK